MSIETLAKPLTYEEERGKPIPSYNHAAIQMNLGVEFASNREFRVCSELTLEFEGRPHTPDLSIYPSLWRLRKSPFSVGLARRRKTSDLCCTIRLTMSGFIARKSSAKSWLGSTPPSVQCGDRF